MKSLKKLLTDAEIELVLGGREEHQTDDNDGALTLRGRDEPLALRDLQSIKSSPNFAAIDGVGISITSVACSSWDTILA